MTQDKQEAELVDFEIVRDSEQPVQSIQSVDPWRIVRIVLLGLIGVAIFFIVLALGAMVLVPILIFVVITRGIAGLLSTGRAR